MKPMVKNAIKMNEKSFEISKDLKLTKSNIQKPVWVFMGFIKVFYGLID